STTEGAATEAATPEAAATEAATPESAATESAAAESAAAESASMHATAAESAPGESGALSCDCRHQHGGGKRDHHLPKHHVLLSTARCGRRPPSFLDCRPPL